MLGHHRGAFESRASLHGARKITVSSSAYGKPRPSHCISDLRFDYADNQSSAILGQWLSPGDFLDLMSGESIISLLFWLSKDMEHPYH